MIRSFCLFWVLLNNVTLTHAAALPKAANLSEAEVRIVNQVETDADAARALLKKVVNINSGTMNFTGVQEVGDVFRDEYEKLGFVTDWIDGDSFQRAGHLVARSGESGVKLLLIGHLDTVFPPESPLQSYKPVPATGYDRQKAPGDSEDKVLGPGITDMKGGDVVMLFALKALRQAGVLDQVSIWVVLTGDEEKRGRPLDVATRVLIDAGEWADIAIGFEDGDGDPKTAVISRRGSTGWSLDVRGRAAHSSQIFRDGYGDGAIFEAARILHQFRETLAQEPYLTFNPGIIVGGTESDLDTAQAIGSAFGKNNVIAQTTKVTGDIRALTPQQLTRAQNAMQRIVTAHLNETSATLRFQEGYPPMGPSKGNAELLSIYNQISLDLDLGEVLAVDPRKAGAADISFVAEYVEMAIDGLGLMGTGGHTVRETADMRTLVQQTRRAALLIHRLGLRE